MVLLSYHNEHVGFSGRKKKSVLWWWSPVRICLSVLISINQRYHYRTGEIMEACYTACMYFVTQIKATIFVHNSGVRRIFLILSCLVVVHPEVLQGLTRVEYYFAMRVCSDSGMFNLVLNPSVLFDFTTSFGRLFQFEITSGKNELASCVVEMVLDVTSYCSSWERRSLVIFLVAYWFRSIDEVLRGQFCRN